MTNAALETASPSTHAQICLVLVFMLIEPANGDGIKATTKPIMIAVPIAGLMGPSTMRNSVFIPEAMPS